MTTSSGVAHLWLDPDEIRTLTQDWTDWLTTNTTGGSVTGATWTLTHPDGTPSAMLVSAPAVMSPLVSVRLAGITLGERVNATCHVTISDGQESDRTTVITGRSK